MVDGTTFTFRDGTNCKFGGDGGGDGPSLTMFADEYVVSAKQTGPEGHGGYLGHGLVLQLRSSLSAEPAATRRSRRNAFVPHKSATAAVCEPSLRQFRVQGTHPGITTTAARTRTRAEFTAPEGHHIVGLRFDNRSTLSGIETCPIAGWPLQLLADALPAPFKATFLREAQRRLETFRTAALRPADECANGWLSTPNAPAGAAEDAVRRGGMPFAVELTRTGCRDLLLELLDKLGKLRVETLGGVKAEIELSRLTERHRAGQLVEEVATHVGDRIGMFEFIDLALPSLLLQLPGADPDELFFTSGSLSVQQLLAVTANVEDSQATTSSAVVACIFRPLQTVTVLITDDAGIPGLAAAAAAAAATTSAPASFGPVMAAPTVPTSVKLELAAVSGRTETPTTATTLAYFERKLAGSLKLPAGVPIDMKLSVAGLKVRGDATPLGGCGIFEADAQIHVRLVRAKKTRLFGLF